jgi:hypothetical protein
MDTLINAVNTFDVLNDVAEVTGNTLVTSKKLLYKLEEDRITWEQGVYRSSNQALYAVLANCLTFCGELALAEAKQRSKALELFYKERGYKYKSEAPLATRVVRAVFGGVDRRRISTYSLVIRQAIKDSVSVSNFAEWVEEKGGIQEIRLGHSETFVSPKEKAETARETVQGRNFLGYAKSELLSIEADPDFIGSSCVLLAEQQADGSFGIRTILRNTGLVNAAFVALYSKQKDILAKAKKEIEAANDADGAISKSA